MAMQRMIVEIEGMHCDGCAETIKALLSLEAGVEAVSVSYQEGRAHVRYDPAAVDRGLPSRRRGGAGHEGRAELAADVLRRGRIGCRTKRTTDRPPSARSFSRSASRSASRRRMRELKSFGGAFALGLPFGFSTCPACTPMTLPVLAAAAATDLVKLVPRVAPVLPRIERIGGVLVLLAAAYFFYLSAFQAGLAPAIEWLLLR